MNRISLFGRGSARLAEFKRTWICPRLLASLIAVVFCGAVSAQESTGRVHAVIINGGMNKLMNHERYWNDCAFLYRTLREDLHFQKQDITLLISDGGEPGRDMLLADGSGFDHGDFDYSLQLPYAWMWGGGRLYPTLMAQWLDAFQVESMSLCLGMCHSGGFVDVLRRENLIIATSCSEHEQSWACADRPYDEFVFHWICAVAGHDPEGNPVYADTDGDGHVSMAEAFDYASEHDQQEETPQYSSTPTSLGGLWCLQQTSRNGIRERKNESGTPPIHRYYDLQGREIPMPHVMQRKSLKKLNAKQSSGHSPIIIIKP